MYVCVIKNDWTFFLLLFYFDWKDGCKSALSEGCKTGFDWAIVDTIN